MGFDDADNNIVAVLFARMRLFQHFIGLADARCGADKDAQLADTPFFAARRLKERFRRGPMFGIVALLRHPDLVSQVSGVCSLSGGQAVEREIKQQDIHARLAK